MSWTWQAMRGGGNGGGGPPIPTNGRPWGVIYSVDFSAQSSVASYSPGAYVIDSKAWYLKGTLIQGGGVIQSSSMVNGTGLQVQVNFSSEGTDTATNLRWFMRLSEIADYNPLAPVALWCRASLDSGPANLSNPISGFCNGAADATSLTLAERATRVGIAQLNYTTTQLTHWANNNTGTVSQTTGVGGANLLVGAQLLSTDSVMHMAQAWTGVAPDPYTAAANTSAANRYQSAAARTNATLGVYLGTNFNGGGTALFSFRNLIIMQPKN